MFQGEHEQFQKEQMLRLYTNYYTSVFVLMVYCAVQCPCQLLQKQPPGQLNWLERWTVVQEVEGLSPSWTNTQGLKITEDNVLPFYNVKWIDILVLLDKDE